MDFPGSFGAAAVGVAFWAFVATAAVAGIVGDYKKRKAVLEPLRLAIEKGQQLDPALVEKLLAREQREDAVNPEHVHLGGVITMASGVGVAVLGVFIGQIAPGALWPIMGAGVAGICVGAGLLLGARSMFRNRARAADSNADRRA